MKYKLYFLHITTLIIVLLFGFLYSPSSIQAQSSTPSPTQGAGAGACAFTRGDQNPKAIPYQSQRLLNYFEEVAQTTGVPAALLAAIARVEATTGKYSISNYTDADIQQMEDTSKILLNVDATLAGTTKALCPRSPTGALGIMQIQPSEKILQTMPLVNENDRKKFNPGAHDSNAVNNGARFIGKEDSQLTLGDYCNPKTEIYIAAGFILHKLKGVGFGDGTKWDPEWNKTQAAFNAAAKAYYGCLEYGGSDPNKCEGPYSYGDDIWNSFKSCNGPLKAGNGTAPGSLPGTLVGGAMASNEVITRVGNACGLSGKTVVLNPGHAFGLTDPVARGGTDSSGKDIETAKNVAVAENLEKKLQEKGYTVHVLHRGEGFNKDNRYDDYQQRIDKSNSFNPDLYVEIHFQTDNAGPFSIYSDRRVISTDGISTQPNPNIVTPNVDIWLENSRKAATAITTALAEALNKKYGTNYPGNKEISDYGCVGRACGGHLYTLGPEGTLANPDEGVKSKILRENKAVSVYIETLGLGNTEQANDIELFASAYAQGIDTYFNSATNSIACSFIGNGTHPKAPPPPDDVRQAIIDKFGITMNGFNHDNLVWAWEKFWDVSNTKFIELAKGTVVTQTVGIPQQIGCKQVLINNSATQQRLNVILLHEIGHVIYWCNPDSLARKSDHANVFAKEGGITGYGSSACFGTPPVNEDYAEMITYYLNPGVVEMIECNNRRQIPFADGKYPIHYDLAKQILGEY